jgi:hypothetical protein
MCFDQVELTSLCWRKDERMQTAVKRCPGHFFQTITIYAVMLVFLASLAFAPLAQAHEVATHPGKEPNPASILGIAVNGPSSIPGISWVRLGYATCGAGNLSGASLQNQIQSYHDRGTFVLLTLCQPGAKHLFDAAMFADTAQGNADAVQCGNEEMKYDPGLTSYVSPVNFARFYDMCQAAVHKVNAQAYIVLGSLDPHVAKYDYWQLMGEVSYLNQMQFAMNTSVHRGGHWTWRSQIVGLINSWHDGYPWLGIDNLRDLFNFWARQFNVPLGRLGQHMWVVEDTGCFKGCGVNTNSKAQVAIAHILALVVDVQTTMQFHVPFFFFSARDFFASHVYWPIGILTNNGTPKPLRQDLSMGSRLLNMSCGGHKIKVATQEQLLAAMYQGCGLPGNAFWILEH